MIESEELANLQKQAYGQAMRFEVLKKEHVESLSKVCRTTRLDPSEKAANHLLFVGAPSSRRSNRVSSSHLHFLESWTTQPPLSHLSISSLTPYC